MTGQKGAIRTMTVPVGLALALLGALLLFASPNDLEADEKTLRFTRTTGRGRLGMGCLGTMASC